MQVEAAKGSIRLVGSHLAGIRLVGSPRVIGRNSFEPTSCCLFPFQ